MLSEDCVAGVNLMYVSPMSLLYLIVHLLVLDCPCVCLRETTYVYHFELC